MEEIDHAPLMFELNGDRQLVPPFNPEFRLLLVDDDARMLGSLCELLKGLGHQLTTASTGKEAIEQLSRMKFDLILLDLRLPDMTGHQIMDFVRDHGIDAHVIVLSGDTAIEAAIGALERGAFGYLRKPYDPRELLKLVDNARQRTYLEAHNLQISSRLERSERLYRYLIDNSPDVIYTLNHEGKFSFVNKRVNALLGIDRDELIGKHYSELVHEDDMDMATNVFNERRSGDRASRNVELRLKCLTGLEGERYFNNTLITIVLNSTGVYTRDKAYAKHEFLGTYGVARDITDRKRADELVTYHAYHDVLTGLPNRILFKDRLSIAMSQAKRERAELAVMFLDLDRFKRVNDTFGHAKGDELLQQVTARLQAAIRGGDTLARLGGDEFTLVLPNLHTRRDAEAVASKILENLRAPFEIDKQPLHISASIGIAIFPGDGETIDELLRHADIAMYQVKSMDKDSYHFYDSKIINSSHQKIILEQSLRNALTQGELEMYYQPQVDATSGEMVGVEALMRWNHPARGLLGATEFIPLAEEVGLMIPLSDWMLSAVCTDLSKWNRVCPSELKLSLNLSPQYLDRGNFPEKLSEALTLHGILPQQIEVEITENISIRSPQQAMEQLEKLCRLGVTIAIDDFGIGYSSLSYLHQFPIHTIKIDQAFVREIQSASGHYPVVLAIIAIAKGLGLRLVAEGVETEIQSHYLEQSGCGTMQGYLYHEPMSGEQLLQMLHKHTALSAQG
ncbi:MAG: EAL domain-containing protein [Gallionellaceae bacterium]|nr:EAL domain-containing protein [Gallionellaceae bacterium]